MDVFDDKLRVGDIITLEHAKPYEGWLCAEDVINSECILKTSNLMLEDCLWQVCVQHQYSSTSEYEAALINDHENQEKKKDSDEETPQSITSAAAAAPISSDSAQKTVQSKAEQKKMQLQRAAITENLLNKKLMAMKIGKPVAFGDVVQLLHVKSQTYLTVSSTTLAKQERENLQVYFDTTGNTMSWLEFMPRYKYDREGQHISSDTETYIRVHENSSDYIHAARKASKFAINNSKEINCSLESSCWKICIYQKAIDTKTKNILLGNLVSLQEPESSTYLTLDTRRNAASQNRANVVMSKSMQLSFSSSNCNVGTNLLWMIEGEDMFHGGAIFNRGSNVALRDLNSGLYMKMSEDGVTAVRKREECSLFELSTSQQSDIGAVIPDGTIIQLSCQSDFVAMKKGSRCEGTSDRSSALSMVITSKLQHNLGVDLMAGVEATIVLRRFESLIRSKMIFSLPKSNIEVEIRRFFSCIDLMSDFLQPQMLYEAQNVSSFKASLELADTVTIVIRQTMLREQGFLAVLLDIVEHCALGALQQFSSKDVRSISFLQRGSTEQSLDLHQEDTVDVFNSKEEEKNSIIDRKADFLNRKSPNSASRQSLSVTSTSSSSLSLKEEKRRKMKLSFLAAAAQIKLKDKQGVGDEEAKDNKGKGDTFMALVKAASLTSQLPKSNTRSTTVQLSSASAGMSEIASKHLYKSSDGFKTTLASEIGKVCLEVLFMAIQKNHASQMAIADCFSLLLNQVKHHREAILIVQEMLKDNLEMLQTKIRDREMNIFLDQLLGIQMNVTLLNLLRSSCTCPSGVDNTQRMVVNALFQREILFLKKSSVEKTVGLWRSNSFMQKLRPGTLIANSDNDQGAQVLEVDTVAKNRQSLAKLKLQQAAKNAAKLKMLPSQAAGEAEKMNRSVLISISEKRNVVRHVPWANKKAYFPQSSSEFDQEVLGSHILKYGIPDLVVNWFTDEKSSEDFSSLSLFGHASETPFSAFFKVKLIHDADEEFNLSSAATAAASAVVMKKKTSAKRGLLLALVRCSPLPPARHPHHLALRITSPPLSP